MKTKSKKRTWSKAQRAKHAATIAARREKKALPPAERAVSSALRGNAGPVAAGWRPVGDPAAGVFAYDKPKDTFEMPAKAERFENPYLVAETYILRAAIRLDEVIQEVDGKYPLVCMALKYIQEQLTTDSKRIKALAPQP